ncbi:acyltransferase family protein [Agaribacter marinus]|uniref:Acyltransferase n=1 Tax=Agaribacter marinus TaxID=1431249 RepID=A0AA37T4C3_9ALTE|nr:acyltransferase family protein [Agaribacter marinus]GLR72894.1 acyltransferase [Agaribacter marinus]
MIKYRPDIDGLRAIAVSSVLLFHFGFYSLSGGYAGVDIFFVISGYLITSITLKDLDGGNFNFAHFYEKRMRRLFPALFGMIIASFIFAYLLFMPDEFKEFGQSAIATSIYLSNFFFWLKSDYFSGPSELKPLLHTWSLAVEEQYYFIFPILLAFLHQNLKKHIAKILVFLILISFIAGTLVLKSSPSAAFYVSPLRFWELLAGSSLAVALNNNKLNFKKLSNTMSYIGASLIAFAIWYLDKTSSFPGYLALLPVIGTLLLIAAGPNDSYISRMLSSPLFVYLGKISYSLYLWHWPVVVFYGYWIIRPFTNLDKMVLICITLGLSLLSYYALEKPFRKRSKNSSIATPLIYTIVFSAFFIFLGGYISIKQGMPERIKVDISSVEVYSEDSSSWKNCFLKTNQTFSEWQPDSCIIESITSNSNAVLWGDSHANHLVSGFKSAKDLPFDLQVFANAGCPPTLNIEILARPNCKKNNNDFFDYLSKNDIDTVILASNWHYAETKNSYDLHDILDTLKALEKENFQVVLINQLPIYTLGSPKFLASRLIGKKIPNNKFDMTPSQGLDTVTKFINIVGNDNTVSIINVHSAFCKNERRCTIYENGHMMVADQAHLSKKGSQIAANFILNNMQFEAGKKL